METDASGIIKSFGNVVTDRLRSPFYGTYIVAWLAYNWEVWYLTLFVSQEKLKINKLDYIITNYWSLKHFVFYPFCITVGILIIGPFLSLLSSIIPTFCKKVQNNWANKIRKDQTVSYTQYSGALMQIKDEKSKIVYYSEETEKIKGQSNIQQQRIQELTDMFNNKEKDYLDIKAKYDNDISQIPIQIEEFMPGKWKNEHVYPNGVVGIEYFEVKGDKFLVDDKVTFLISNVKSNQQRNEISFIKIRIEDNYCLLNEVKIDSNGNLRGTENKENKITYSHNN